MYVTFLSASAVVDAMLVLRRDEAWVLRELKWYLRKYPALGLELCNGYVTNESGAAAELVPQVTQDT